MRNRSDYIKIIDSYKAFYPLIISYSFLVGVFYNIGFSLVIGFEFFSVLTVTDHFKSIIVPFSIFAALLLIAVIANIPLRFRIDNGSRIFAFLFSLLVSPLFSLYLGYTSVYGELEMIDYSEGTEYKLLRIVDNGRVVVKDDNSVHYFSSNGSVKIKLTDHVPDFESAKTGETIPFAETIQNNN